MNKHFVTRQLLLLLAAALILLALSACGMKDRFYCEHCHQAKFDTPHYITVNTVDTVVCSDCFESYQNGEWTFP